MEVTCRIDTSNLMAAQKILNRHSKTAPARSINKTAYFVINDVIEANGGFPVVAQSTIDTQMEVSTTPRVSTRGTSRGEPLKSGASDIEVPDLSAAMKITIARMNPNSAYSRSTGNRWPVAVPGGTDWHGLIRGFARAYGSENAFAMALDLVRPIAERMVRARHSSTGFIKKSWIDLRVSMQPLAFGKNNSGATLVTDYSEVEPAKEGYAVATCKVSNTLGVGNRTTRELSEKYNQANHRIAEPRIVAAINREFAGKMKFADAQEWAKMEPELKALGMLVKP